MANEFGTIATEETEVEDFQDTSGCSATRTLTCAWSDRLALRDKMMAWPRPVFPHNGMGAIIVSASYKPFGRLSKVTIAGGIDILAAEKAIFTVKYETPGMSAIQQDPQHPEDRSKSFTEGLDFSADMLTLNADDFGWQSQALGELLSKDEAPAIPFRNMVYHFTRYYQAKTAIASLNLPAIVNCTNSLPWTCALLPYTWATETMLVGAPKLEAEIDGGGAQRFTVQYEFPINPWGWNKFRRPSKASPTDPSAMWWELVVRGSGQIFKPFPPKDLTALRQ